MKKTITLLILSILMGLGIITILPSVLGEIQYWQTRQNQGNGTMQNHIYLAYSRGGFGVAEDYVTGSNPYEVYLLYNIYVKQWNTVNPTNKVDYCEWKIKTLSYLGNQSTTLINLNYSSATDDVNNAKYFIKLNDGDVMIADQICHFQNLSYNQLYFPAEMQLVTPSWECKECQYYQWSIVEKDIVKAKSIGDKVVTVSDYIKKLFLLNFEILLALFWFFLILMIFVAIGFVFLILYWLYLFLENLIK